MSTEIFAKIGDIKGESADARHPDEIVVVSFSWGVSRVVSGPAGGGAGAGKAAFQDLTIVHTVDNATPGLLLACATARRLSDATISHRRTGKNQPDYLVVKLTDVTVLSVTQNGESVAPYTESVTLRFAKVDLLYRRQRPNGSFDDQHFVYDLRTNTAG